MLIPRAVFGSHEVERARATRREHRAEALRLLQEAAAECEGCGDQ